MKIIIKSDTDEKEDTLGISNEHIDNCNYVEILTAENHMVLIDDLYAAVLAFKQLKLDQQE